MRGDILEIESLLRRVARAEEIGAGALEAGQAGAFAEIQFDLATAGPTPVNFAGHGMYMPFADNAASAKLTLNLGENAPRVMVPGSIVMTPMRNPTLSRHADSVRSGVAQLVGFKTTKAFYAESSLFPPQVAPIDILGNSRTPTFVAQGENARPATHTLAYDGQTVNFGLGLTATGTTSGATGVIVTDADAGTTGTLELASVTGTWVNDEAITDTGGGAAVVNGVATATASSSTSFIVTGWKRVRVLIDMASGGANATSVDLIPWFREGNSALWYEQGGERISIPDTALTGGQYRVVTIPVLGIGRMHLEIRNLLAAARTSLGFIVQGIE